MESRGTRSAGVIPTHEFALYSLGGPGPAANGTCRLPFSPAHYSRYKYGSVAAAETFARALGAAFCEAHPELILAPRLLMASSPYAHVPAAATTLARGLQPVLNAARAMNGLAPAPLLRVDRISTSAGDYGTLSAQARDVHMAANVLSFRRFRPAQVRGAHLLVIDDVRVTGAHQRCLMHASEDLPFVARIFPYIAAVPRQLNGCFDPAQEDALNHTTVKTLDDLAGIVAAEDFAWNVRVCKFTLSPANRGELPRFVRRMPDWFIHDLHRHSYQDGYARMTPRDPCPLRLQLPPPQRRPGPAPPRRRRARRRHPLVIPRRRLHRGCRACRDPVGENGGGAA
jgi:PRTase ComF-like